MMSIRPLGFLFSTLVLAALFALPAQAERPALVITNDPLPKELVNKAYISPVKTPEITAEDLVGQQYYKPTETMVSRKIKDLASELAILQDKVIILSEALNIIQRANEGKAANYYAAVATINTQLQSGTTPGNPRLLERFTKAENSLEDLAVSVGSLNHVAIDSSKIATEASFLLDSARATYGLSGAVEEDHVRLAGLEDQINSTIVMIERLLNTVNDDMSRTSAYLSAERDNLRTLSFAISEGNVFGRSLADRPFAGTRSIIQASAPANTAIAPPVYASPATAPAAQAVPSSARPLVKITFDQSNVDYEQPLYNAVQEALKRFPDATFDVLAVHPAKGNAAEVAIESTRARRNAQKVIRTLADIGVPADKVDLSYNQSNDASFNEVHVYIR